LSHLLRMQMVLLDILRSYKMYKLGKPIYEGQPSTSVIKDGNMAIPFDPANTDYQEYLKWVAEGNTPEPADEV
jgi:hypothetical protein